MHQEPCGGLNINSEKTLKNKFQQIKQPPRASAKLNWFYGGYILFIYQTNNYGFLFADNRCKFPVFDKQNYKG